MRNFVSPRAACDSDVERVDPRQRRRLFAQLANETLERTPAPFDLDSHATGLILDEAAEIEPRRQGVDKGPETDALHSAFDRDGSAFHPDPSARCGPVPRVELSRNEHGAVGRIAFVNIIGDGSRDLWSNRVKARTHCAHVARGICNFASRANILTC